MITDEALDAFRAALRARVDGESDAADRLGAAVRALAQEASAAALGAEHLVIRIKAEWDALVRHDAARLRDASTEIRDRMITTAIRAYYVQ